LRLSKSISLNAVGVKSAENDMKKPKITYNSYMSN